MWKSRSYIIQLTSKYITKNDRAIAWCRRASSKGFLSRTAWLLYSHSGTQHTRSRRSLLQEYYSIKEPPMRRPYSEHYTWQVRTSIILQKTASQLVTVLCSLLDIFFGSRIYSYYTTKLESPDYSGDSEHSDYSSVVEFSSLRP